jgi:hypothetical protein
MTSIKQTDQWSDLVNHYLLAISEQIYFLVSLINSFYVRRFTQPKQRGENIEISRALQEIEFTTQH